MTDSSADPVTVVVDGFSHRFGGSVTYLRELLPRLACQPQIRRVRLLVEPGSPLATSLSASSVDLETVRLWPPGNIFSRVAWEAARLSGYAADSVVLSPNA